MRVISGAFAVLVCGFLLACSSAPNHTEPVESDWLVDMTQGSGLDFVHSHGGVGEKLMIETMTGGAAMVDVDGDGWLDLYFVQSGPLPTLAAESEADHRDRLYLNTTATSDRLSFAKVDSSTSAELGYGMGVCAGDVDNDGDNDLYRTAFGADALLINENGRFSASPPSSSGIENQAWSSSCAFGDFDRDGCLDLFVVNYLRIGSLETQQRCHEQGLHVYCHPDIFQGAPDRLYRGQCDGRFVDVSHVAGVQNLDPNQGKGLGVIWSDFDDDSDLDIYVSNDSTRNFLYRNESNGTFTEIGVTAGAAFNDQGLTEAGMGVDAGDIDGDGHFDLVVTHLDFETNTLYRNLGAGFFVDASTESGIASPSMRAVGFGVNLFDIELDGDLDIFVANGHIMDNIAELRPSLAFPQPDQLLLNDGHGRFREAGRNAGPYFSRALVSRASMTGDLDNDGDLDLVVATCDGPPVLLENRAASEHRFIGFELLSHFGGRPAIGAKVTLHLDQRVMVDEVRSGSGYLSQSDFRLFFGLGTTARVERVEIRWPEGGRREIDGSRLEINRVHRISPNSHQSES